MTSITKELKFDAAHVVHTVKTQCGRLHGHTWRVVVEVMGEPKQDGMVVDFGRLKEIVQKLDHRVVLPMTLCVQAVRNDDGKNEGIFMVNGKTYHLPLEDVVILPIPVTTAESLAEYFAEKVFELGDNIDLVNVTVWETESACATYAKMKEEEHEEEKVD